jgi:Domain of unknown function (DUF6484)
VTYEHNETNEVVVEFNRYSENEKPRRNVDPLPEKSYKNIIVGELIGLSNNGRLPLVSFPGQPDTSALQARSVVNLDNSQIGQAIVLMFENADPHKPIIMGVINEAEGQSTDNQPRPVEVDADGERLLVSAKEQVVLRCGKASITLTKAGKVLIQGTYVVSRSSGANRIKGGSIQLN